MSAIISVPFVVVVVRRGRVFLSLLFPLEHVGAYKLVSGRNVNVAIPV